MEEIKVGEIVYATITVEDEKNKTHELRKVVFSREWKCDYPILRKEVYTRFLSQNNVKTNCTDIDVKIIEPITRSNSKDIKRDVDMFIGSNSSCSIIVVKER